MVSLILSIILFPLFLSVCGLVRELARVFCGRACVLSEREEKSERGLGKLSITGKLSVT